MTGDPTQRVRCRAAGLAAALCLSGTVLATTIGITFAAPAGAVPGQRLTDSKNGYSFVLPTGWSQIALSGSRVGSVVRGVPAPASLHAYLTTQATNAASRGLKFYAVSIQQANGSFLPVINVGTFKNRESLSGVHRQVESILSKVGATNLLVKNVNLGFGKAVEGTFEVANTASSTLPIWETQVYAPHHGQVFVTTFSATTNTAVELTAASVMATWHFVR